MTKKLLPPIVHGINDYVFSAVLLFAPYLLEFNKKAQSFYRDRSVDLLVYNALTDHPAGIKKVISYKTHHKLDILNVAGLALLSCYKPIRSDKKVLSFHLGFVALAAANILLTNWHAGKKTITSPVPQPAVN